MRPKALFWPQWPRPRPWANRDQKRRDQNFHRRHGGRFRPEVSLEGAATALLRQPDIQFIIYGQEDVCQPILAKYPKLRERAVFHHCDVAIRMDEKPSQALRRGRYASSMWRAIEAVKLGEADAAVSAGNTGALMAMSKFCLRTMANVERPAIAGIWPTMRGESTC